MVTKYFDCLAKLVQHHIHVYPRLSVKGTASPRSCFSGVLTSLLCGSGPTAAAASNYSSLNTEKKKQSLFDMSMPSFSIYSTSSQNFNSSSQYQNLYQSIQSSMNGSASTNAAPQASSVSSTSFVQSVLCNRDMLVCLLLKCAVNLITDLKVSSGKKTVDQTEAKSSGSDSKANKQEDSSSAEDLVSKNEHAAAQIKCETSAGGDLNEETNVNGENFYEDDLLIHQLFLFELEQIEDSEAAAAAACGSVAAENEFSDMNESEFESLPAAVAQTTAPIDEKKMSREADSGNVK